MVPALKAFEPPEAKTPNFVCINLRQWATLFSILIFIMTAIITTCTFLGTLHSHQLLHLLEEDIDDEHEKHLFEFNDKAGLNPNEVRLQHSHEIVLTFSKILSICMWLAWLNLFLAAILIYGVTSMASMYIIPWVLLSGTTYLVAMTTVIMAYLGLIPGLQVTYTILLVCFASSLVFIEMWYTIVLYYVSLSRGRCSSPYPTVVHAYGGYTHTIQPLGGTNKPPPF